MAASEPTSRTHFYASLPAKTYLRLRRLAGLTPIAVAGERKAFLARLSKHHYDRLLRITAARSAANGRLVPMQSVLVGMIEGAKKCDVRGCSDMQAVVVALIESTPIRQSRGSASSAASTGQPA